MTITPQRCTCECGHMFETELVTGGPLAVTIASMQAVRCPGCGSSKVGLGGGYNDSPSLTASIIDRAAWWRDRGEIGTSSLTIWCAFTGGTNPHRHFCHPLDPDDFRRCRLLLALIPEWRTQLSVVVKRFLWFAPFADKWEQFDALYSLEEKNRTCPKLYAAMKVACKESDAIRYGETK